MDTFISINPEQTVALGESWGRTFSAGTIVYLSGDLGAGKTQLARGIARGLGFQGRVHSPTFALVNHYEGGRLPVFHLDLYRLENPRQILGAGLEEYFRGQEGVTIVEWAERWLGPEVFVELKSPRPGFRGRLVRMTAPTENERKIVHENFGT